MDFQRAHINFGYGVCAKIQKRQGIQSSPTPINGRDCMLFWFWIGVFQTHQCTHHGQTAHTYRKGASHRAPPGL